GDLLRQQVFTKEPPKSATAQWRVAHADRDAPGYVVSLGGTEFLCTDGSRGLVRWNWTAGLPADKVTAGELPPPGRIVSAPAVLPPAGQNLLVCLADSEGRVTLFQDQLAGAVKPRSWTVVRSWDLKGKVTSGPFVRGGQVG